MLDSTSLQTPESDLMESMQEMSSDALKESFGTIKDLMIRTKNIVLSEKGLKQFECEMMSCVNKMVANLMEISIQSLIESSDFTKEIEDFMKPYKKSLNPMEDVMFTFI